MKSIKFRVLTRLLVSLGISGVLFTAPVIADTNPDVLNKMQLQTALEAFGLSTDEAKNAVEASITLIEENQLQPDIKHQEIAEITDGLLDMSPY